jgi:hypothetical protein
MVPCCTDLGLITSPTGWRQSHVLYTPQNTVFLRCYRQQWTKVIYLRRHHTRLYGTTEENKAKNGRGGWRKDWCAWVRERTIPTERQPLVGEVSAKLLRIEGCPQLSVADTPRPYSRFSRLKPLHFLTSSSSVALTRLSGPRSRPAP